MSPEIGSLCLFISLALALVLSVISIYTHNLNVIRLNTVSLFITISIAFFALISAHAFSDFSVLNVYLNSHTSKPLIYKISGAWGNHEGSMLLWLGTMALFTMLFAVYEKGDRTIVRYTICIQGLLLAIFLIYVIYGSNPFERLFPPPKDGLGLNAILQDIGLALHPPVLYLGYVGFSLGFSIAVASLFHRKLTKDWPEIMRPWILLSWIFLTAGISLGSWWAYRELGWGGYWYWDPVENASLIPWLTATGLIHSLLITRHYQVLRNFNILLAIITFSLSLVGTFLVRSGIITSVHTFASDPNRGIFILLMLIAIIGGALLVYAIKGNVPEGNKKINTLQIPRLIIFSNILFILAAVIVLFGTIYPLFLELLSSTLVTVAAPYFNSLICPLAVMLCVICIFGSQTRWNLDSNIFSLKKSAKSIVFSILMMIVICFEFSIVNVLNIFAIIAGLWLISTILESSALVSLKAPVKYYGMFLAHLGFGILVLAIAINTAARNETEVALTINEKAKFSGFEVKLLNLEVLQGQNYFSRAAVLEVIDDSKLVSVLEPEIRYYPVEAQQTVESSVLHRLLYDFYVTMGDQSEDGKIIFRLHYLPVMGWIWFSCMLICFGGIFAFMMQFFIINRRDRNK